MKDATGELSMTAIAVVAIAAIGVVFTTLIWPAIKDNITRSTRCSQTYKCDDAVTDGMQKCYYYDEKDGGTSKDVMCPAQ